MDIEGLEKTETVSEPHRTVTVFRPVGTGAAAELKVERLSSGKTMVEYFENGRRPKLDPTEEMLVDAEDDRLAERIVRAMAVRHMGVSEAASNLTAVDLELMARGFTLGFSEDGYPVWIRLTSPMTVVLFKADESGLPVAFDDEVTTICIIPGRRHVKFECGNVRTALTVVDSNRAFDVPEAKSADGNLDEPVTVPFFLDRKSVVLH